MKNTIRIASLLIALSALLLSCHDPALENDRNNMIDLNSINNFTDDEIIGAPSADDPISSVEPSRSLEELYAPPKPISEMTFEEYEEYISTVPPDVVKEVPDGYTSEGSSSNGYPEDECIHGIDSSFHTFDSNFIELVGGFEAANEFFEATSAYDNANADSKRCRWESGNIYNFIKYFNISREDFEKCYYGTNAYYSSDHDPELLYNGTLEEIEEYYINSSERADYRRKLSSERTLKYSLVKIATDRGKSESEANASSEAFNLLLKAHRDKYGEPIWVTYSIPELIDMFEITKNEFETYITGESVGLDFFEYDIEKIFDENESLLDEIKLIRADPSDFLKDEPNKSVTIKIDESLRK